MSRGIRTSAHDPRESPRANKERAAVIHSIVAGCQNIYEVADKTGLDVHQVQSIINSLRMRESWPSLRWGVGAPPQRDQGQEPPKV
jgi:hypothetical protein